MLGHRWRSSLGCNKRCRALKEGRSIRADHLSWKICTESRGQRTGGCDLRRVRAFDSISSTFHTPAATVVVLQTHILSALHLIRLGRSDPGVSTRPLRYYSHPPPSRSEPHPLKTDLFAHQPHQPPFDHSTPLHLQPPTPSPPLGTQQPCRGGRRSERASSPPVTSRCSQKERVDSS